MPSQVRTYSEDKRLGRVYTPEGLVAEVLAAVGYDPVKYPQARLLDPACGDGQFLVAIVRRILERLPPDKWREALAGIEGWDIDPHAIEVARTRLQAELAPYGLPLLCQLSVRDSLMTYTTLFGPQPTYDFIVGNPPYVRIQHLPDSYKTFLQKNFSFCRTGSTDLYLAFFELGLSLLAEGGKLGFITPNTWLYTEAARPLRTYLLQEKLLERVIDYDTATPFPGVGAYIAITVLSKERPAFWQYERRGTPPFLQVLPAGEWFHTVSYTPRFRPLGEVAYIGVGITTLADEVFILFPEAPFSPERPIQRLRTRAGQLVEIETPLLRPIIKASTFQGDAGHPQAYIIFPYTLVEGKYRLLPEGILQQYPLAYVYLSAHKERLLRRDGGKPNPEGWYAFGRHQNLEKSFGKKILFPPISPKPRFGLSRLEECTVYSGYFIKYDGDYEALLAQLNSERMEAYIRLHSRPFRGGWRAYNKKVLERFPVEV
ncbi:MAG: DNA methyltransferase [Bacteroidia bacterium]|jgi:methylase of polypeptide subunit release factors|nr:MAG: DNA methyltransferase [Bacteroidia bacterium]